MTTTIKVRLRRSTISGKEGSLFYSLVHHKKTAQITTRYKLLPSEWNEGVQMVIPGAGKRGHDVWGMQQLIKKDLTHLTGIISIKLHELFAINFCLLKQSCYKTCVNNFLFIFFVTET